MKIGFNGRFLLQPYTGIGQYSINLLTEMARLKPEHEWVVALPSPLPSAATRKPSPAHNPVTTQPAFPPNVRFLILPEIAWPSASLRQFWWEQVQCPRALFKENPDLIHYPYPSNPRFKAPWTLKRPKIVVTVHDLIPWKRPEYRRRLRSRWIQRYAKKALKKADHLIAVSQTTGLELTDHIQFPFHHISVIHEAAAPIYRADGPTLDRKKPYFLYVGGYDPRKNVTRLIEAFEEYIAPRYDIDLFLVGAKAAMDERKQGTNRLIEPLPERIIENLHETYGDLKGKIIPLDALTPEKLATHYRGAIGFLNVSLAEGFNLPLLEAAASHLPILTSDLPIHREIIGSHGLFCDPISTKSIGEMILNFLRDRDLQIEAKQNAATLAEQYTWDKAAQATLSLYEKLM